MTILFKKSDRLKSEKQREALNLFSKKKCIDSLDELLIMPLEKQKFEKLNAEGQKTRIKVFAKLTSLESMSLEKLRVITLYFRVFKTELDISSDKLKRLISILDDFLDTTKFSIYLETKYVFRSMVYVYPFHNNIGRLYSFGNSLQKMPRIFRRFLLGDIYVDVDIINAHPCILLEYAIQHSISCETLTFLVENREAFYNEVSQQISVIDIKKEVISIMNKKVYSSTSILLNNLFQEIIKIRDSLWTTFYYSNKNSFDSRKDFNKKSKVTVQSLYCQTKETDYLITLYDHFYSQTNGGKEELHFIPFFDGALVKFKDHVLHASIPTLTEEFNMNTKYVKFKVKAFEDGFKTTDNFLKIENICKVLPYLLRSDINLLKKKFNIKDEIFDNDLINDISKNAKKHKEEHTEISKKWKKLNQNKTKIIEEINKKKDPNLENELQLINKEMDELKEKSIFHRYYRLKSEERKKIQDITSNFENQIVRGLIEYADSEKSIKDYIKTIRVKYKSKLNKDLEEVELENIKDSSFDS